MRSLNNVFRALLRKLRDQGPDRTWWIKTLLAVGVRVGLWLVVGALHS